jgi:hypothetical protein
MGSIPIISIPLPFAFTKTYIPPSTVICHDLRADSGVHNCTVAPLHTLRLQTCAALPQYTPPAASSHLGWIYIILYHHNPVQYTQGAPLSTTPSREAIHKRILRLSSTVSTLHHGQVFIGTLFKTRPPSIIDPGSDNETRHEQTPFARSDS